MASSAAAISSLTLGARFDKKCSDKSCLIVGTADGGLGLLAPIDEGVHRTLALLQQIMSTTVPSSCGLNPRQFRQLKVSRQRLEKTRGILDGNVLWQFANLEDSLQDELAFAMGTTADTILDNLLEIDMLNSFF
jgi:cleavage and polyadenylation specificity factor subunit 1